MNTLLSDDIEAHGLTAKYDQACKQLLSHKIILAWIMKYCVEEYKDCTIEDIAEKYIEGTPSIGAEAVRPNFSGKIFGTNTEDSIKGEHTIRYDIKFNAITPDSDGELGLIINLEAQNDFYPGYPLVKRGIYYCSRIISAQDGTVFVNPHYEKLKKVYSIWICMNPPEKYQNTAYQFKLVAEDIIGETTHKVEDYDILRVVHVCLGDDEESDNKMLRLLNVLLSEKMQVDKRRSILDTEFDIPMQSDLSERVNEMCNLSQGVLNRGIEKGIEQGLQQGLLLGRDEGREDERIQSLRSIMKNTNCPFDDAAKMLGFTDEQKLKYAKILNIQ